MRGDARNPHAHCSLTWFSFFSRWLRQRAAARRGAHTAERAFLSLPLAHSTHCLQLLYNYDQNDDQTR